jgi:hypothetical protein
VRRAPQIVLKLPVTLAHSGLPDRPFAHRLVRPGRPDAGPVARRQAAWARAWSREW